MSDIEALGVNTQEPFHSENQIGLRRLDDQMKMIAHEVSTLNSLTHPTFTRLTHLDVLAHFSFTNLPCYATSEEICE